MPRPLNPPPNFRPWLTYDVEYRLSLWRYILDVNPAMADEYLRFDAKAKRNLKGPSKRTLSRIERKLQRERDSLLGLNVP